MSLLSAKILGISISIDSKEKILEHVKKYLIAAERRAHEAGGKSIKPYVIVTPNPEQIVLAQRDKRFAAILNQAAVALPDGYGIVLALRFLTIVSHMPKAGRNVERIPGVEYMQDVARLAAENRVRIGLIGGRDGVAVRALECLREASTPLEGWAEEPEGKDAAYFADKIRRTKTRIVFVGLGAPKQEYFIERLSQDMSLRALVKQSPRDRHAQRARDDSGVVLMSVGGAFDMLSGTIQRAPVPIRKVGMEWAWRLFQEPWRWRRQLALVQFVFLVLKEKMLRRWKKSRLSLA